MTENIQIGQYLEIEPGVDIYYTDQGEGSPIVFLPGWTFSSEVFESQVEYFSKKIE